MKPNELGFQKCASGYSGGAIYVYGSFKYFHVQFGDNSGNRRSIFDQDLDLLEMIANGEHHEDTRSGDCKKCQFAQCAPVDALFTG